MYGGDRSTRGFMRTVLKPEWAWLKQWNPHANYRAYYGLDGYYQSGQVHIDLTEVEFAKGGRFGPEFNIYHEGLQEPFDIARGVTLPPGSYNYSSLGLDAATNPSAPLSLAFRGDFGGLYNGTRNGVNVTVTARKGASLTSSLLLDYQDVHLDQGDFVGRCRSALRLLLHTEDLRALLVQYSNRRGPGGQRALRWLNTAARDCFVAHDGRERLVLSLGSSQARSLVIKYTRKWARDVVECYESIRRSVPSTRISYARRPASVSAPSFRARPGEAKNSVASTAGQHPEELTGRALPALRPSRCERSLGWS